MVIKDIEIVLSMVIKYIEIVVFVVSFRNTFYNNKLDSNYFLTLGCVKMRDQREILSHKTSMWRRLYEFLAGDYRIQFF